MITDETMTPTADETPQAVTETAPAPDVTIATEPVATEAETAAAVEASHDQSADLPLAVAEDSASAPAPVDSPGEVPAGAEAPTAEVVAEAAAEAPVVAEAPAAAAPVAPGPRDEKADADLFESYMNALDGGEEAEESGYKRLSKGDRVEATVIQVEETRIFVDLGTKSEGIVPLSELTDDNVESAIGLVQIGDKINVVVIKAEGGDSNPIVSKKRADFEAAWDRIEEAFQSQQMITAQVVDRVKGGLVVDVGVRGFVPATHVGSGKLRNIEKYVGNPLQLKVLEIDRERKKVVLSNREAEEQRKAVAKETIFNTVKPGDILDGTVRRLADYGAFVDLGGVDGLLHISEMSWMRINHPKEMFKEGQKIKVMVLRLDPGVGKISLGHRQVLPDPWNLIKQNYTIGQKLTITIGRLVQSGAFVKLPEGAEAFLPVSEMSIRRIKRPQDVIEEGQEIEIQVIDLRPDERRMVLSMRAAGSAPQGGTAEFGGSSDYNDEYRGGGGKPGGKPGAKKGAKKGGRGGRDDFEDYGEDLTGRRGFATGGATIGERLGALRGILGRDDEDVPEEEKEEVSTDES
jgi:4-hydroxy-3-methylbut-2-enyl diphosphate reductase